MKRVQKVALGALIALVVFQAGAVIETRQFDTPEQEALYAELIFELRCLVCQNNNLQDSNAELAIDLRKQVYELIMEKGYEKAEIVDYMVQRYGDFVLYRPPVKGNTLLLWFGPAVLLVAGLFLALGILRKSSKEPAAELGESERSKIKKLLDSGK